MKKACNLAILVLIFASHSCQPSAEKVREDQNDSTPVKENPAPQNTREPGLVDPDTTDQVPLSAYGIHTYRKEAVDLVRSKLQAWYKNDLAKNFIDSPSRKFTLFEYDLNGDSREEIFVGLTGPYFCGTGGCNVILFSPQGDLITQFSVTRTPIVVSNNRTHGWNDLFIMSGGRFHIVKFNNRKYPSNPSIQPVSKLPPGDELPRLLDSENEPYPQFSF